MAGKERTAKNKAKGLVKFTDTEHEAVLERLAHLDRRGYRQSVIAEMLTKEFGAPVHQPEVSVWLKEIRKRYAASMVDQRDALVMKKLDQLADVRAEAWDAYDKSKGDKARVVDEYAPKLGGGGDTEATGGPRGMKPRRKWTADSLKEELVRLRSTVTTEGRLPASEFLKIVLECLKAECELLGLNEPIKVDAKSSGSVSINWNSLVTGLPPYEDKLAARIAEVRNGVATLKPDVQAGGSGEAPGVETIGGGDGTGE